MDQEQKGRLSKVLKDFAMVATYIPQDLSSIEDSRGVFKRDDLSKQMLKYDVAVSYKGRPILVTPYSMGIGHIPGFREPRTWTVPIWDTMKWVFREGKAPAAASWDRGYGGLLAGKPILPDLKDVMYSLVTDSSVLDSAGFEDWAQDYGYDTDSRKAERIYRECMEIALKFRNTIGQAKFDELRDAFQDY